MDNRFNVTRDDWDKRLSRELWKYLAPIIFFTGIDERILKDN